MFQNSMLQIIPAGICLAEDWSGSDCSTIFSEEIRLVENASEKRRRDFLGGRNCARRALGMLGLERMPILRGPSREPLWPEKVIGSITHCEGYCAAAVGWTSDLASVGIDAEMRRPLDAGVLKLVATEGELQRLTRADASVPWEILLFSAKESVFKTWFPLMGTWLGFDEAEIEFDPDLNSFRATLNSSELTGDRSPRDIRGRYQVGPSHVFTCAFIQAGEGC